MKNYIGLNINYLCSKNLLTQKDFGNLFGLTHAVINAYIKEKSNPQVETIQKICQHFDISIDDFINLDLTAKSYQHDDGKNLAVKELQNFNYEGSQTFVAELETKVAMQADLILTQKELIESQKDVISNLKGQLSQAS